MLKRLLFTTGFYALLMLAAIPMFAQAAENNIRVEAGSLSCGNTVLNANTTYLINLDYPGDQVIEQKLTLKDTRTNQQKEIKIDGNHVIKHVPEQRKVLDSAIDGWACIKSKWGKNYFFLSYYCTSGEEKGICERGKVQWIRILNEDGSAVVKEPRHRRVRHADDAIYKSLGLYDLINEVQLESIEGK